MTEENFNQNDNSHELKGSVLEYSPQLNLFVIDSPKHQPSPYSNQVGIYDVLPKYIPSAQKEANSVKETRITRMLKFDQGKITIQIRAALIDRIDENGLEYSTAVFPGEREEFIEEALRKLAVSGSVRVIKNNTMGVGVEFSLYELSKELERTNHTYSYAQIKEGLAILRGASLEIFNGNNTASDKVNFLNRLHLTSRNALENDDSNTKCVVEFNSYVRDSILNHDFRQYNYEKAMLTRSNLARYILRRMSYFWTQASPNNPYTPKLVSFLEQSPKEPCVRIGDDMRAMNRALDELIRMKVVNHYDFEKVLEGKRKIIDVCYAIYPHAEFIKDMKRSNKIRAELLKKSDLLKNQEEQGRLPDGYKF